VSAIALRALGSANTKLGVAKLAAGNKITAWRSRRLRGVIAPVAGRRRFGAILTRRLLTFAEPRAQSASCLDLDADWIGSVVSQARKNCKGVREYARSVLRTKSRHDSAVLDFQT
jgi:hypothetical protein